VDLEIIVLGFLICFIELFFIYFFSPKKLEVRVINNIVVGIIYSNYFLLPLTTKIIKYDNLKKAFIRDIKDYKGVFYDLLLEFATTTIILFKRKEDKESLLNSCNKINESVASFKECIIEETGCVSKRISLCLVQLVFLVVLLITIQLTKGFCNKELLYIFFKAYIVAFVVFTILLVISLILNYLAKKQRFK
jgi:hypothetical protein